MVELVLRDTATRAAPTHAARRMVPTQSIRLMSWKGVCLATGVADPEAGFDGTV